ncbi:hypothetical protein AAG906_029710 [Vitis piasezkii]
MEIGVEGEIYIVSLWWEIPPRREVRDDVDPRAGWRVGEKSGAGTKEQRRSEEVTGEQSYGPVGDGACSSGAGLDVVGWKRDCGLASQGPDSLKRGCLGCRWGLELLSHGPAILVGDHLGQRQFKSTGIGSEVDLGLRMEMEFIKCREKESWDKQTPTFQWSMADREIMDEACRYGSFSNLKVGDSLSSSSPLFGRTPLREPCDHSGVLRVSRQSDILVEGAATGGDSVRREGCWDLVAIDCEALEVQNPDGTPTVSGHQAQRSEKESDWEKSSLAKFSKLLGFSIEGLEREILDFLSKIRKRRERIHSKGLLEKTKFERELKRGANDVNKRRIIKSVVRKQKVDLMCIQETKIQPMTDGVVKSLGVGRFLDWRTLEAAGAAGGVLVCWDKRALDLLEWEEGQFSVSCKFRTVENGTVWVFTGVYGPFNKKDRECLWEELGARSRQGRVTPAMRRFAQVMDDLELIDLPLQGGSFTWSGGLYNQAWARLDRFLVSPRWLDQFSNVTQKRLSRPISDHFPITIEGGGKRRGPSPFRFENMWLRVEGFKDLLRSWWQGMVQVDHWDQVESERRLSEEEFARKKEAKDGYAKWVKMDEIHWRQLSRELWLREGDKNTGYFHRMANAHRRRHTMERVKISGVWLSEECTVRTGIVDAFHRLLTEDSEWKADIGEVHSAIRGMNGDKAPGPDGFTGAFWQFCWEFVKEEVMEMFKEFHEHKTFLKSLNATFWFDPQERRSGGGGLGRSLLVLIPKKGGVEDLNNFRPISLVGRLYKWLTKVLANILKGVLAKVISMSQNAFVEGRQIMNAMLIADETINSILKSNKGAILCKLDIEKAYDHVDWSFLLAVLEKMGFGEKRRRWIKWCLSTTRLSVLVNGTLTGFFQSSRGLRQEDPFSPYLFVIVMEAFSYLLKRTVSRGFLSPCSV